MSTSKVRWALSLLVLVGWGGAQAVNLADAPLFSTQTVPGNVALALSVEWPTATTPSYLSTSAYASSNTYIGYFDAEKCYQYNYNTTKNADPSKDSFFDPYGAAVSHTCSSSESRPLWSGNYLNWASMQTLDVFRWALTGGSRTVDALTDTIITKTFAGSQGGGNIVPDKNLSTGIAGATPFTWAAVTSSIKNRGISLLMSGTAVVAGNSGAGYGCDGAKTSICLNNTTAHTNYNGQNSYVSNENEAYANPAAIYEVFVNVRVCKTAAGLESNCKAYGSNYKPEGLMQKYSSKMRFAAFGYLNDQGVKRDGGVLRAPMKYIGPTQPVPGSSDITNPTPEWSGTTGIMLTNPDSSLATSTSDATGVSIVQSGAMNYLNKFGLTTAGSSRYKGYDPVSELYYSVLRYFRNIGPVPEYADMSGSNLATKTQYLDSFPVAATWTDPIVYSCQKNFVLGIGDVNTHRDSNLPGTSLTDTSQEPPMPPLVTSDATNNGVNVTKSTSMVGQLQGLSGLATTYISNGRYDTNYVAGLAYDAHTVDIRQDLSGSQTINTYWVDVMEGQVFVPNNEYWLATKYGGFAVPDGFQPYSTSNGTATLLLTDWYNNSDTIKGTDGKYYKRPDNYYPAFQGAAMVSGLSSAFSKISSELASATTTAFSSSTRKVSNAGNASYAASYDPSNWTGKVVGSTLTYDNNGLPVTTPVWDARSLLEAVTPANRKIVTCCTSAGAGLSFTYTALSTSVLSPRTLFSSFSTVPGVSGGAQSAANYVSYMRGDHSFELANGGAYRNRVVRLGDIVGSKANPVGAPSFPYYDSFNPGYSSFKKTWTSRKPVVYVGANDGMLHAFDGGISGGSQGQELFAYIPSFTYGDASPSSDRYFATYGLASLGNPSFTHHYFVNATALAFDLDMNNTSGSGSKTPDWRTLLIGGMGKGGKGYYALDVTDPTSWTTEANVAKKVLWEFTDPRMGMSFGDAHVVKTAKYGWVVLLSSGYNNSDGKGYLFVVNPRTGALLEAIATPTGDNSDPTNMAALSSYIADYTDYTADTAYAGDLNGKVWRFDLTGTTGSYPAPVQMATLTNSLGTPLPVTTKPLIAIDPTTKKRYILVGTGRLLDDSDIASSDRQGFFAMVDGTADAGGFFTSATMPTGYTLPLTRAQLSPVADLTVGITGTPSAVGWYTDFLVTGSIAERMNIDGDVSGSLAAFAVNLPNGNVCSPAGTGRYFAISFASAKTALIDDAGNPVGSVPDPDGVATEVAIQSVDGTVQVTVGDSAGQVRKLTVSQDVPALKRLNWREISTVN
jgi:type IV pilus assembly protein PilY1